MNSLLQELQTEIRGISFRIELLEEGIPWPTDAAEPMVQVLLNLRERRRDLFRQIDSMAYNGEVGIAQCTGFAPSAAKLLVSR